MNDLNMTNDQITAKLDELDAKMDLFKARAKHLNADAKAEGQELFAKLTNKRRKTAEKLDQYSKASGIAVEKIGLGLQESMDDLNDAVKEAGKILKDSAK
jgi:uncharacterized protein YqfA (UPF0365 family)